MTRRIAIIASSLHPERQQHLIDWYLDLKEHYPNCQLFIGSNNKAIPFAKNYKLNTRLEKIIYNLKNLLSLKWYSKPLRKIRPVIEYDPDVIHLLTSNAFENIEPFLRLKNVPLIVSFRGFDINVFPHISPQNLMSIRRVFESSDLLHFVSRELMETAISIGADEKKCFVRNRSLNVVNLKAERNNDKPIIISVGRLVWQKGYLFALQAIQILKNSGCQFEYHIIGKGMDFDMLRFYIDYFNLNDTVVLLGEQNRKNVFLKMQTCDIFLQTSVSEGLPITILEASLHCLPIVSTDIGGIPEAVEDGRTGFLHPICSPEKYAESLRLLIENKELRIAMGKKGRKKIEEEFSREEEIQKWLKIYKEMF